VIRVVLFERQFADVTADRVTFQEEDIVLWFDGTEVARHHLGIVEALEGSLDRRLEHARGPD